MFNITILDDNPMAADELEKLISSHRRADEFSIRSITSASEIDDLESSGIQTHILFADILLPDEPSGIQVVKNRFSKESGTQVIYVSGYLKFTLDVYETDHIYFLLKPVSQEKLDAALDKALDEIEKEQRRNHVVKLNVNRQVKLIPSNSICYVESNLRQVSVHTNSQVLSAYMKLDDIKDQLPNTFVRCHKSFLVNLAFVEELKGTSVSLRTGAKLPVSKKYSAEMKTALMNYLS